MIYHLKRKWGFDLCVAGLLPFCFAVAAVETTTAVEEEVVALTVDAEEKAADAVEATAAVVVDVSDILKFTRYTKGRKPLRSSGPKFLPLRSLFCHT
jgi:hypothetical protein